jgi:pimeloyl-ACP methyl ester carboxylesterase
MPHIAVFAPLLLLLTSATRADTHNVESGTFDSNGVKIAYVTAGRGEPVVLVHGLYSSAAMNWQLPGTFQLLAEHYQVVALDLRGHGQSDKPEDEAAYGQPFVDDVVRLMDHLKIERAHVVGYSLGGIIVMKLIVDHPQRVIDGTLGGMGWLRPGSWQQAAFERMGAAGNTPPACVHGIAKLAVTEDQVKAIRVPIHIFVGDRDPCRRLYIEPLERVRPDIGVTEIRDAGHLNCIAKPEFKEGMLKWIEQSR